MEDFATKIAAIRGRFAARLPERLDEICTALSDLIGEGEHVSEAVYATHRRLHDLCGISPTLGFSAIGQAARACEQILLQPSRDRRGLTEFELAALTNGLADLRSVAAREAQCTASPSERAK